MVAKTGLSIRVPEESQRFDDDGDILAPLRAVRAAYLNKAAALDEKAYGDNRERIRAAAGRYRQCADAITLLIDPTAEQRAEVYDLAIRNGVMTTQEVRVAEGMLAEADGV